MKIQARITTTFVVAFTILFLGSAVFVGIYSANVLLQQAYTSVRTASETRAEHIRMYLSGQKEVISMLSASTVFRDFLQEASGSAGYQAQKQRTTDRLIRIIRSDENINEIFLIDRNGAIVASTNETHVGWDRFADPFFQEGRKGIFIKDVYESDVTRNLAWGIGAPINEDKTGMFMGVVVARMNIEALFSTLGHETNIGESGETFLLNKEKYFLTPSYFLGDSVILQEKVDTENSRACFDEQEIADLLQFNDYSKLNVLKKNGGVKVFRDYRNVVSVGTHAYIPETGWCLITKADEMEVFRPIINLLYLFLGTSTFGIFAFIIIGSFISKKITKPIEQLENGLSIIRKGNLEYRVGTSEKDEIGALSREFDTLTLAVKQSRLDIERKVLEQTGEIIQKGKQMEDQQKAILNILDDVELEKKKAELLASDLSKFQMAVENASDHIVITDTEGAILYANKAVEAITGFAPADITGKKAGGKDLWGGLMDLPFYELLWKTIKSDKKVFSGEIQNKRKDGVKYVALASISPVIDNQGVVRFFVGIERDITREKEIDRMKTEFISLASHQLRTPLSAMKWFGEMLLDGDAGTLTGEQKEMVTNIYVSNERMIDLVNSLLNISRIESGRLLIDPQLTNVDLLIRDVVKELQQHLTKKGLTCVISVHENLPEILLDAKLIRQVYMNLLTNAVKYTPKGGEIQVYISKNETDLVSQVTDNGYGIPTEEQGRVFEKFFRGQNITKLETEGTGLGLYLIKTIIDSSGGKIWFESTEGKGTTFWFTIPLIGMTPRKGDVGLEEKTVSPNKVTT